MEPREPREPKPNTPESRSMNEQETKKFLTQRGVRPLAISDWEPGTSFLYVLEEEFKTKIFKNLSKDEFPSIALVHRAPEFLGFRKGITLSGTEVSVFYFENAGPIDYYTINIKTGEIKLVKTSNNTGKKYFLTDETIYHPAPNLFPGSK